MTGDSIDRDVFQRLNQLGGNKLTDGLIQMYLSRTPEKIQIIQQGIDDTEFGKIENVAHTLISSAGNLGGMLVSKLSAKIEAAAMARDLTTITQVFPALTEADQEFREYLEQETGKS